LHHPFPRDQHLGEGREKEGGEGKREKGCGFGAALLAHVLIVENPQKKKKKKGRREGAKGWVVLSVLRKPSGSLGLTAVFPFVPFRKEGGKEEKRGWTSSNDSLRGAFLYS